MTSEEQARLIRLEERVKHQDKTLEELLTEVKEMRKDFTKAKGVYAGVVMAVSVVWGAVLGIWSYFKGA